MENDPFKSPFLPRLRPRVLMTVFVLSVISLTYYTPESPAQSIEKKEIVCPRNYWQMVACLSDKTGFQSTEPEEKIRIEASPVPQIKPVVRVGKVKKKPSSAKNREALYHPIILRAAKRHSVDPALVKAIIKAESGYNARAVSKKGAKGLMQLMPKTAKALGVKNSFDPEHNVNGGVKYFRSLLDKFNDDIKLAVAAYNAGSSKVRKHNDVPPIRATQIYVKKVLKYYHIYKNEMEEGTAS
jgi:soluble lytic murein transglycosylase-like protein